MLLGKSFTCEVCDKKFAQRGGLRNHMITHWDDRPLQCPKCDWRCKTKDRLNSHMRCHSTERPYCCEEEGCNAAFGDKGMYNHL